jgi:hypothetical protein
MSKDVTRLSKPPGRPATNTEPPEPTDEEMIFRGRIVAIPICCVNCARRIEDTCGSFKRFQRKCTSQTNDYAKLIQELDEMIDYNLMKGNTSQIGNLKTERRRLVHKWNNQVNQAYLEDKHRGSGGGGNKNEGSRQVKQLMKDNRDWEVKILNKQEQKEYKHTLTKFEEENGALPKLKPDDGITRSKVDSYTGDELPEVPKKGGKKK